MAKYALKYMYDWGSGICLWSVNDAAREKYDYPIELDSLPLSDNLKNELEYLINKHDEALDWEYPPNPLLWSEQEQADFIERAKQAYYRIVMELGDDYEVKLREKWLL